MKKAYTDLIKTPEFHPDKQQEIVVNKLYDLQKSLLDYQPKGGLFAKWLNNSQPPKGYFVWGSFGRGKSFLMDLFLKTLPISADNKQRYHFHDFMQMVHKQMHQLRKKNDKGDYIAKIAKGIIAQGWLLCLDEYEVKDVTDSMILSRLFEVLIKKGVVLVITSNMPPREHYKDGLQRQRYDAFCDELEQSVEVISLEGDRDFRGENKADFSKVGYLYPNDFDTSYFTRQKYKEISGSDHPEIRFLKVLGRRLEVRHCNDNIALFDFVELCEVPLGSEDYKVIAQNFGYIFLENIPQMDEEDRNAARRFITLIDVLYENKTKLYCTAEVPMQDLYIERGDNSFEFNRTVSRLKEMSGNKWLGIK